jgi:hypothetical protein
MEQRTRRKLWEVKEKLQRVKIIRTTGSVTATNQKKLDVHKQTQRSPESSAMGCSVPANENEDRSSILPLMWEKHHDHPTVRHPFWKTG